MSSREQADYEPFDELISQLRAEGFEEVAAKLHTHLHETAWTTGSELLGELGLVLIAFQRTQPATSGDLNRHLDLCLILVRRVWPKLGK